MARLLPWPDGLRANAREPLAGPQAIGAGSTTSIGNFTQTYASPFALWRWRFAFPNMRGQIARRYRGWLTAMHGGANATRVPFCDWDGLSIQQMGISATLSDWLVAEPWASGDPWSSGVGWRLSPPTVAVAASAALDASTITLSDEYWGHSLGVGDMIGFEPLHFGMYMVTEVIDDGQYRIWPPLRKAITTDTEATLRPTLVMRMESEEAGTASRSAAFIENASVIMVEVPDYDVRDYFTD